MTKKDVLIFLNIYLLGLRGIVKKKDLQLFSEDVINILSDSLGFSDFIAKFTCFRLSHDPIKLGFYFNDFLRRSQKAIDKIK